MQRDERKGCRPPDEFLQALSDVDSLEPPHDGVYSPDDALPLPSSSVLIPHIEPVPQERQNFIVALPPDLGELDKAGAKIAEGRPTEEASDLCRASSVIRDWYNVGSRGKAHRQGAGEVVEGGSARKEDDFPAARTSPKHSYVAASPGAPKRPEIAPACPSAPFPLESDRSWCNDRGIPPRVDAK